jgi:hypothetical protein
VSNSNNSVSVALSLASLFFFSYKSVISDCILRDLSLSEINCLLVSLLASLNLSNIAISLSVSACDNLKSSKSVN